MRVIFWDRCRVVHIPFVCKVELKFPAHLSCTPSVLICSIRYNPLVTVPKAPIKICIIVTHIFHSFFQLPSNVHVLILLSTLFQFYSVVSRDSKVDNFPNSLFLLVIMVFWLGLGDPSLCQSPLGAYVFHFLGQVPGCAYTICWCGQI